MPSHFTHLLFAEEALRGALGERAQEILDAHGNLFRFGAQGPDFFYHNQRTMPTGLRYGVSLHRHGYGNFVEAMAREALRLSAGHASELSAFILGFTTHAPLDRRTHPFIGYFAGWDDPRDERTRRLHHSHPFLERILDLLVLEKRFGKTPAEFDFLSQVRCGKTLPYPVIKELRLPTDHSQTFYTRHGDVFVGACAVVSVVAIGLAAFQRNRLQSPA